MAHKASFHTGWEKENLAAYLLSRIGFIVSPHTIGDDIGIDYFCTLYEKRDKELIPKPELTFAIQIKSNKRTFSLTKWLNVYAGMSFPFFIGVIRNNAFELYSGKWFICMVFRR